MQGEGPSPPKRGLPAGPDEVARDYPELLQRVPAAIYIADTGHDGTWHYVSPQIEAILGFSAADWCADPELWRERLHPDDRERVLRDEEDPTPGIKDVSEYRMIHRQGRIVWLRDDAMLVPDHEGRLRWHGVLSDVTDRKRVEAELELRAAQQAAVAQLGEHALEGAGTTDLMHEALKRAGELLDIDFGAVVELLPEEGCFVLRAMLDGSVPEVTRVPGGVSTQAGYTVLKGKPVIVEDWRTEERFAMQPYMRKAGVRSGVTVVIESTRGPFGVLGVQSKEVRQFTPRDIDFLQSLANVLADALERQAIEDDIRHRALHDPLTGLPNRVLFLDRLDHALARLARRESIAAILFLDLDQFKFVNDSLGHQVGDELLAAAAPRLKQAVRASDTVARFGGDEFGILLEDISSEQDAIEMAERIAGIFARPFVLAGNEHFVSASIGIAVARGGELPQELIRDADAAMYRAKERGRARYEMFDAVMRERAIARLRAESDLRRAIERGELRLDYQPVIALRDRSLVGVEALLRWDHPDRGVISPAEFIPMAEENGLIVRIGNWVLDEACRQGARWYPTRPDQAPLGMSVNLSALQLAKRDLPDQVASALRVSGLDPACLSLEITETAMLREIESLAGILGALKALGVRLVLDDFGTGYSSLGYLTQLPLDALKIDRSFVDGLGIEAKDGAITEAIIAMSRALSLDVIAEGVEEVRQARELIRLGCQLAQGFLYFPPLPGREISTLLRDAPRRSPRAIARD